MYKRVKLIESTVFRKIFAYIFASLVIIFFILATLYRDYVFKTYGVNSHKNHSASMQMPKDEKPKKQSSCF